MSRPTNTPCLLLSRGKEVSVREPASRFSGAGCGLIPGNESGEVAQQMEQKPNHTAGNAARSAAGIDAGKIGERRKCEGRGYLAMICIFFILKDRAIPGIRFCVGSKQATAVLYGVSRTPDSQAYPGMADEPRQKSVAADPDGSTTASIVSPASCNIHVPCSRYIIFMSNRMSGGQAWQANAERRTQNAEAPFLATDSRCGQAQSSRCNRGPSIGRPRDWFHVRPAQCNKCSHCSQQPAAGKATP